MFLSETTGATRMGLPEASFSHIKRSAQMSILSWLRGQPASTAPVHPPQRAGSSTGDAAAPPLKPANAAPAVGADGRSMVAGGLDFVSAIHEHQHV